MLEKSNRNVNEDAANPDAVVAQSIGELGDREDATMNTLFRGEVVKYPPAQQQANPDQQHEATKSRRPFYKKLREYQHFEVQKVPYSDYINDYILAFKEKKQKQETEKLLYYQNLEKIGILSYSAQIVAWIISLACALIYGFTSENFGV